MSYKYKSMSIVQLKFSHKKTQENAVVTHEVLKKYIHIYSSTLPIYCGEFFYYKFITFVVSRFRGSLFAENYLFI
jgi:hypothetical protein